MNLKSMTKAWAAVAVGLLLFSCAKEKGPNENPPVVTLGVSTEELNFTAEEDAPAQTVEVTSNALWQAAVDDTWLEIDKEKGYQNGTITVSIVEGNGSTEARTATLTTQSNETYTETRQLLGLMVNLADYSIGATKGGEITHFTDFDIRFNQEISLLETRCSGMLTKIKSAIALAVVPS